MKIDYEVNVDENGYHLSIKVDGKSVHESQHAATDSGAKQISGDKDEHCKNNEIYELLQDFLPFTIFSICRNMEME